MYRPSSRATARTPFVTRNTGMARAMQMVATTRTTATSGRAGAVVSTVSGASRSGGLRAGKGRRALGAPEQEEDDRHAHHEGDEAHDLRLLQAKQEVGVQSQEGDPEAAERIEARVGPEQHPVGRDTAAEPPDQTEHREVVEHFVDLRRVAWYPEV